LTTLRTKLGRLAVIVFLASPLSLATAQDGGFKVGDKVEAYNVGWYKATVLEIGSGSMSGYLKVHYDDFSSASDQFIALRNIRARPNARSAAAGAAASASARNAGPRLGRYLIRSYGNPTIPIPIGELELLSGGRYRAMANGGRVIGQGTYSFDAASSTVQWLSGPYKEAGWLGQFTIERDGKTHKIRVNRVTIATNSTDS